jgi:hypothetical protein
MSNTTTEVCENCGKPIGKLETPRVHDDHVVCPECWRRLQPEVLPARRVAPAEAVPTLIIAAPSQVPPPVARQPTYLNPIHTGRIVTTEKTAKSLKLQQLISTLLLLASVTWLLIVIIGAMNREPPDFRGNEGFSVAIAAVLFLLSLAWRIYVRIATWWRHG